MIIQKLLKLKEKYILLFVLSGSVNMIVMSQDKSNMYKSFNCINYVNETEMVIDNEDDFILNTLKVSCQVYKGNPDYAEKFIEKYSKSHSDNSYYLMTKGILSAFLEEYDLAHDFYLRGIEADKKRENKWIRFLFANLFIETAPEISNKYLDEALLIDPFYYDAIKLKIYQLDTLSQANEILFFYSKLETKNCIDDNILAHVATALYNEGLYKKSKEFIDKSLSMNPDNSIALSLLGNYYYDYKKNNELAEHFFKRSLEIDHLDLITLNNLAWLYCEMGKAELAEKRFMQLIQLDNDNQFSYFQLVGFYITTDKDREALKWMKIINEKFDYNYFIEAYTIILDVKQKGAPTNKFYSYKRKYGIDSEQYQLLVDLIEELVRIKIE